MILIVLLFLVVKIDLLKDIFIVGFGDILFGVCWEFFLFKVGCLFLILFGNVFIKIGDSFYEINVILDLVIGKGYYLVGVGVSMCKYIDFVVLFVLVFVNYGFKELGLD